MFLIASVALASILPCRGEGAVIFGSITNAAITPLFFLHGAKLSREAILAGIGHWRLHLLVAASTFVLFPALGLLIRALGHGWIDPKNYLLDGILFLCVLPSTVQSSIAFTSIAKGNVPAGVCSATLSNVSGIFITPVLVGLFMGSLASRLLGFSKEDEIAIVFCGSKKSRPWTGSVQPGSCSVVGQRLEVPMRTLLAALTASALAVSAAALTAAPALAAEDAAFAATTLNLSATGESHAAPDMANVSLGVQVQAPTAEQAMAQNAQRMSAVIAALRRAGVADRDIRTSNLNLQAQYAFPQNQARQLTGYEATNGVTVEARDLARLGALLDAAVQAGANQVNGISFGLKDPHAAEDAARLEAVKALQAKAELYAKATGYKIGRLVNLSEGGGYEPSPPRPLVAMAARKFADTPVEAGTLDVRIEVNGMFELNR